MRVIKTLVYGLDQQNFATFTESRAATAKAGSTPEIASALSPVYRRSSRRAQIKHK
jgi:hypothetical protein